MCVCCARRLTEPALYMYVGSGSAAGKTMKRLIPALLLLLGTTAFAARDFYDLKAVDAAGKDVSLEEYRGKVSLVVNVASECGYTDQNYRELVQLQKDFGGQGFTVLAFPCNQFGAQEPGSMEDVVSFARSYGINFPLFSKVDVHGTEVCEVYSYLIGKTGTVPQWNFCKYLVDRDGSVRQYFSQNGAFSAIRQSILYLLNSSHNEL